VKVLRNAKSHGKVSGAKGLVVHAQNKSGSSITT
jgi:hypothetical protein